MHMIKEDVYYYLCEDGEVEWEAVVSDIALYDTFLSCTIKGRGSHIRMYIGKADTLWVCFPELEKATSLSCLGDTYWNSEKISLLLDSVPDGISVAYGIQALHQKVEVLG